MNETNRNESSFFSKDWQRLAESFRPAPTWDKYEDSEYADYEKKTGYTQKYLEEARKKREVCNAEA